MNDTDDTCEQLSAYLDGELPPEDALRVQHAVARDTDLADELERLRVTRRLLGELPRVAAPEGFTERVVSRAERLQLLRTPIGGGAYRSFRWITVAAAAVVLLAVGLAVLMILSSIQDVDPTPTPPGLASTDGDRDKDAPAAPDDGNTKGGGRLAVAEKKKLPGGARGGWNGFPTGHGRTKRLNTLLGALPKDLGRLKSVSINTDNLAGTQEEVERLLVDSGVQAALVPARAGDGVRVHYFVQSATPAQITTLRDSLDGIRGRQRVSQAPVRHAAFATLALAERSVDDLSAKLISPRRGRREAKNEELAKKARKYGEKVPGPMVAPAPKTAPKSPPRPGEAPKPPATKSPSRPQVGGAAGEHKPPSSGTDLAPPAAPKPLVPVAKPEPAPKPSLSKKQPAPSEAAGEPAAAAYGKLREGVDVPSTPGTTAGPATSRPAAARRPSTQPATGPAAPPRTVPTPRPAVVAGGTRKPKEDTASTEPAAPSDLAGKRSHGDHGKGAKKPSPGGGGAEPPRKLTADAPGKKLAVEKAHELTETQDKRTAETGAQKPQGQGPPAKSGRARSSRAAGERQERQTEYKEGGKEKAHRFANGSLSTQPTDRSDVGDRMLVITVNFLPLDADAAAAAGVESQTKPTAEPAARKK